MPCHSLPIGHRKRCDESLSQNVPSHSLPVGHRNKIGFPNMCNVTHSLLVIGKDVMRLPFTSHLTHKLKLVMGTAVMRLPFTNVQSHSHAVGHRKR